MKGRKESKMGRLVKEYLGNRVYAQVEVGSGYITLTTEDRPPNNCPNNIIHLDPRVIKALKEFIDKHLTEGGE